ncbi:MAG: YraN family protein [Ruminococcaceae bacterium]|nr:YraN family protein [Oscillospiraceae bacterium]
MKTNELGSLGETTAAKFLRKNGYKILERNKHESHDEIDIIASNKEYIVFVEVKTRSVVSADCYLPYGAPSAAVNRTKQLRLLRAARAYLRKESSKGKQPRMDVIEIYYHKTSGSILKINHIPDAFGVK